MIPIATAALVGTDELGASRPFDRLIAVQAIIERLPILTVDPAIRGLGAAVFW